MNTIRLFLLDYRKTFCRNKKKGRQCNVNSHLQLEGDTSQRSGVTLRRRMSPEFFERLTKARGEMSAHKRSSSKADRNAKQKKSRKRKRVSGKIPSLDDATFLENAYRRGLKKLRRGDYQKLEAANSLSDLYISLSCHNTPQASPEPSPQKKACRIDAKNVAVEGQCATRISKTPAKRARGSLGRKLFSRRRKGVRRQRKQKKGENSLPQAGCHRAPKKHFLRRATDGPHE